MQPTDEPGQTPGVGGETGQPTPPLPSETPPSYTPPNYGAPPQPPAPNYDAPPQQPPPGYIPPGYGMQQGPPPGYGYPPPGQQPPPGYGYPPPGQQPPPGYGYPPPLRPAYVPPAQYHVPPTDGRPPEFVPPAVGTLFQAWRALGRRPSRQNYAAWAQAMQPGWIRSSVITATAITLVFGIILFGGIFGGLIFLFNTVAANDPQIGANNPAINGVLGSFGLFFGLIALVIPLNFLASVFAIPFGQAVFMSSTLGTLRQRYDRALKPWALAQVPLQFVSAVGFTVFVGLIALLFVIGANQPSNSTIGALMLVGFLLYFVVLIPLSIYSIAQQVQAGSVGTGLNRWAVFGINLLTGFVLGIALNIVTQPLFFFLLPALSHFSTTPSGFLPFH